MNEPGVGRSGGLTNWYLMDVATMWACLADHDTTNHWRQVAGWRKICDLAQTHLGRLQEYRRGLAEAWPPETNEASRTYLGELDQLIEQVRRTHDAAATNYTALSAATQAIGTTREALRKIHDEYAVKFQQRRAYEATAADPKAIVGSRVTEPPVTDGELERLNVQARGIMYGLSSELQQAQVMLRQPPPARPVVRDPSDTDVYSSGFAAPVIPPIVPVPISATSTHTSARTKPAVQPLPLTSTSGAGPVLGAAGAGLNQAPTSIGPHNNAPNPIVGSGSGGNLSPPLPGAGQISNSTPILPAKPTTGSVSSSPHSTPPSARAMPLGGLIGGIPGAGLGQPASGGSQPRRVNPIGGVIGGGGAGTAPTGGAGSRPGLGKGFAGGHALPPVGGTPLWAMGGTTSAPGRAPHRGDSDETPPRWDPDNPWDTNEGVDPIVRPPDDGGPIDSGPAIGLNR